jgi:signal transduction histidine kinase/ligand-binding sensor domain-containing protein
LTCHFDPRPKRLRLRETLAYKKKSIDVLLPVLLLLLFISSATSLRGLDPDRHLSQYAHTAWRLQDGAFSGRPNAIVQTSDGYVWIGTDAGLVRFDGVRFTPWNPPEGEQLPSTLITSLLSARDGSLWIGTAEGLSHWSNGRLGRYVNRQGTILSIIEDRNGTIWIARLRAPDTAGSLCQVVGIELHCYGTAEGIYTPAGSEVVTEDAFGNLWIGYDRGLLRWKPYDFTVYNPSELKSNENMEGVTGIISRSDGSLWVGILPSGSGLGLEQIINNKWKPFITPELDGSTLEVETLFLDREDALWVGTLKQGIYRIYHDKVEHFVSTEGLSGDRIRNFFEDREGNLWIVTSKGIDNLRDIPVTTFSTQEGLGTEIDSVLAARDGTVWIGGADSLASLRHNVVSSVQAGKGLPGTQVTSMFEDHAGRLWVGIDRTLNLYRNGTFRRIDRQNGSPVGLVVGITEDSENNIWIETSGTPRKLIRIQDLMFREEFPAPQMPAARRIAADPSGGLWLGLMDGDLTRYRQGTTEVFRFNHATYPLVEQVTVNPDGSVLAATALGLLGWKNGRRQTLTVANGLPCGGVYAFVFDNSGALWLSTQCGLVKFTSTELQSWWTHPDATLNPKVFDATDGFQIGRAPFAGAARSTDGRLWFVNNFTLQMVDPEHLKENKIEPLVHVEEIIADRRSYSPQEGLRLAPLTRDLDIRYTALSFVNPQKVFFRYRLLGRDAEWQDAGTRRQAFYNDLRPGNYRFQVVARNNDGVWNNAGATIAFIVAPAWYQTTWFRLIFIVIFVLLGWLVYKLRVRQVASAISARFDESLAERTRLARELHDTLLQTIQGSKMVADDALEATTNPERMRRALEQLSVWQGKAMQEGRAALHSLRISTTESDNLPESFRRTAKDCLILQSMDVFISVIGRSKDMHPIVRDEVYRIGREAIRNACLHSGGSRLEVALDYTRDFRLRVVDNGLGIDQVVADLGKTGHFGLKGMRERAHRIGAKLNVFSSPESGTEVNLMVPGHVIFVRPFPNQFTLFASLERLLGRDKR